MTLDDLRYAVMAVSMSCTPPAAAEVTRTPPPLLDAVTMWLVANYDLLESKETPLLVGVPDAELVAMRYGAEAKVRAGDVFAIYLDDVRTIFVSESWTGSTPAELSILVHEMVHHLQLAGGTRFACPAEREVLAYRAQDDWLGLFGESLDSSFGIDAAALLVGTVCTH